MALADEGRGARPGSSLDTTAALCGRGAIRLYKRKPGHGYLFRLFETRTGRTRAGTIAFWRDGAGTGSAGAAGRTHGASRIINPGRGRSAGAIHINRARP